MSSSNASTSKENINEVAAINGQDMTFAKVHVDEGLSSSRLNMTQHQEVEEAKLEPVIGDSSSSCSDLSFEIKRIREKLGLNMEPASMNAS